MKAFFSIYPFTNRLELRRATCITSDAESGSGGGEKIPTAFISYTKADWGFVHPFAAALREKEGVKVWVDKWERKSGRENHIAEAQKADVFVPVLSAASIRARGVLAEIDAVTDKIVKTPERVIPVILGKLPKEQFPPALWELNYVSGIPENSAVAAAAEVARWIRLAEHLDKSPVGGGVNELSLLAQLARVDPPAFKLGILLQMAGAGDAAAQTALGVAYYEGDGVPRNEGEAAKWFRRAAKQGIAEAQFNLGLIYHRGEGVYQDDAEAVKWYYLAAEQGLAQAQSNLGVMYYEGKGVPPDNGKAAKWWRRAAEQGHVGAQSNLGIAYNKGAGVPQDYVEAVKWWRRAAEQGFAEAQSNLGGAYHEGKGVPPDNGEAAKWWCCAAEQGHASAQYNLGVACHNGRGVPQDDGEAVKWWCRAAKQGFAEAQYSLGVAYLKGRGVPQDDSNAVKWLRLAAEQGNADAKATLARLRKSGDGKK